MRILRFFLIMMGALVVLPGLAPAYSLPAQQVLEFAVKAMGQSRGLAVDETVLVFPGTADAEPLKFTGTAQYRFPDTFREHISNTDEKEVFVVSPKGSARVRGDILIADTEDLFDLYKDILLYQKSSLLLERMELSGVNVTRKLDQCIRSEPNARCSPVA